MPEVSREEQIDVLIGRVAVERKLITREQLRDALAEQAHGVTRGRARPRRLGAILSEKNYLSADHVLSLEQELEKQILDQETWQEQDMLFGQILTHRNLARPEEIEECMNEQAEVIQRGETQVPLLGELLVERGYVSEDQVAEVLAVQERTILACSSCGRRSLIFLNEAPPERCDECGGRLDNLFASERSSTQIRPVKRDKSRTDDKTLGKYTLHREIGSGRMGAVYEALDTQLNRKVALKFILAEIRGDDPSLSRLVERFGVEAEMAARLPKHPNIVSVYEAGDIEGKHYIAMELVRGKSMARWQRENTPSVRRQLRLLRDVAAAVHFAHEHDVIHRDLKPQNVMVDPDDQPMVTDFGLAQALAESSERQGAKRKGVAGTPRYMSPEQASGEGNVDRRSDVFSLGVILFEILTGRPPFQGNSALDTRNKILNDPVPSMAGRVRGLPRTADTAAIEAICQKALAKKPEKRLPSAGALAQELGRWLRTIEPGSVAPRKKPIPTAWILGGAAALMALTIPLLISVTASATLKNRIQDAENLRNRGSLDEAMKAYDRLLQEYPDEGSVVRGWFRTRMSRDASARSELLMELEREVLPHVRDPVASDHLRRMIDRLRSGD